MARMKYRNIVMSLMALFFLAMFISNASAVQYWQWQTNPTNYTTKIHGVVAYDTITKELETFDIDFWELIGFTATFPFVTLPDLDVTRDAIESGKPLEVLVQYYSYVDEWNDKNPNNQVNHCNLTISYSAHRTNFTVPLYSRLYRTQIDDGKYFIRLDKGDTAYVDFECLFEDEAIEDIPADFTIVLPTWECLACQYYNWQQEFVKVEQAETLQDYRVVVTGYIKSIFLLNYEALLIMFWILSIGLVFMALGLIFFAVYWLYLYIKEHTK